MLTDVVVVVIITVEPPVLTGAELWLEVLLEPVVVDEPAEAEPDDAVDRFACTVFGDSAQKPLTSTYPSQQYRHITLRLLLASAGFES